MTYYARGKPNSVPVYSRNAGLVTQASGEVVVTIDVLPDVEMLISSDGKSLVAATVPLATVQAQKWAAAKVIRQQHEEGRCATAKGVVQTNPSSQAKINAAAAAAQRWQAAYSLAVTTVARATLGTWSIDWTMADNSIVTHNAAEMVAMADAVTAYLAKCHAASVTIRAQIFNAKNTAAVQAIDLTAGYPT